MFTPKFTLTPKLLTNLTEIERFYGQLEGIRIPKQLELNLERTNLIESSYASNSIEGNPLSVGEVTNLLLNDRVPTNRSEKEVVNYFLILKNLEERKNEAFDLAVILAIHKQLLDGVNDDIKGKIRNVPIIVGKRQPDQIIIKHNPSRHDRKSIEIALNQLTNWLEKTDISSILKAGIFHHEFVYLHPFEDGNGRVCRLLTALILLSADYRINKYFVLDDYYDVDRSLYSDSLHSADWGDKTNWLEYFTDGVKYSLQSALGRVREDVAKLSLDIRPSPKEHQALEIARQYKELTSSDLVKELNITRQQAFNLLKSLTEKGFLEKKGATKSSFYILR
ncbi:Fic family protein [Patescibacteria group bacterium]|nr:Fic family protein [Patescibacteria group bacterium]MCL5010296.1 Fic family protein [Patescibacteria group bacterium]